MNKLTYKQHDIDYYNPVLHSQVAAYISHPDNAKIYEIELEI